MGRSLRSLHGSISVNIQSKKEFFLFQKHSTIKSISLLILVFLVSLSVLFSNNASADIETVSVGLGPVASCLNPNTNTVYVSNFFGNTISLIDGTPGSPTENTVIGTIIDIPGPTKCIINQSTKELYVINEFRGLITIIDIDPTNSTGTENTVIDTISILALTGTKSLLTGIDFNPVTELLYVTDRFGKRLFVIDIDPTNSTGTFREIINTLPTGILPLDVLVNPATNTIYVANNQDEPDPTFTVIDGETHTIVTTISVKEVGTPGKGPLSLTLNADDEILYVTICDNGRFPGIVAVVDIKPGSPTENTILASIPVESPAQPSFDPENNLLYVPNQGGNSITIIDTTTNTRIATIPGGDFAISTTIDIANQKLYVPNFRTVLPLSNDNFPDEAGTVTILDLTDLPPVANAGPDQSVNQGVLITLDGSGSSDSGGDPLSFSCTQIVGTTITLSSDSIANPTFTTPPIEFPIVLTFQLTVNDGTFDVQDIVHIFVRDATSFEVALNGTGGVFTGSVDVGNVTGGSLIQLDFPTSGLVDAELQQLFITTGIDGTDVIFTFDIRQDVPVGDTSLIFSATALYFDIGFTGIDLSSEASFLSDQLPNTKILIDKDFPSDQQFSDGCSVMSFSVFNEGTGIWELFGDPLKPNANKIYVTNSGSDTVSVIDASTNTVVATIDVGTTPFDIAFNPNTKLVYVINQGSDSISVINGDTNTVVDTISVGDSPIAIAINPDTNTLYLVNDALDKISVIDGSTNTVVTTIDVGTGPVELGVNPSTNTIYVVNQGSDTVSVIDGSTNTVVDTIVVGDAPSAIGVNPNTNRIYVANSGFDTVSVINGATNTKVADTPVGDIPVSVVVNLKTNMVFVYVANVFSNSVSVIDGTPGSPTENLLLANIDVGNAPSDVDVNPNIDKIFVTNNLDNSVSVIDGSTNTEVAVIIVGSSPIGLVVDSDVPNPVRDPSSDVLDASTGEILQCAYFANMPHLSKFAIGGVKALALGGAGGGVGEGAPILALSTFISNNIFGIPDEVKAIAENYDPFVPLSPITIDASEDFDYPLIIDNDAYLLVGYENTIETHVIQLESSATTTMTLTFYESSEIAHVSLYTNLNGIKTNIDQSDTQILFYKDKPIEVIDPHGYFGDVKFSINEIGDIKKQAIFEITFVKPMKQSDIIIRAWDDSLHSSDVIIRNAIEVVAPNAEPIFEETIPEPEVEQLKPQNVPIWIKNNANWWSQEMIEDSDFVAGIEYLIQEKIITISQSGNVAANSSDEIPTWIKNNAGWWSEDLITEKEFIDGLQWLISNGIISVGKTG